MNVFSRTQREAAAQAGAVRAAECAARTPEQQRETMIAAIIAAMRERGAVTLDDLIRAGVPRDFATANFKACLALAKDAAPDIAHIISAA